MLFRFIRTGYRPIEETDHDYNIRAGFLHCLLDVTSLVIPSRGKLCLKGKGKLWMTLLALPIIYLIRQNESLKVKNLKLFT